MIISAKIKNDKYYTPPDLAQYIVNKTKEIIGEENITEYIEPSAGAGVFLDYLEKENAPYLAYDIEPEDNRIIKQDFLTLELEYKKGRCVIGNPPFGRGNSLSMAFYKKSIHICDYISFISPISQYNNNVQLYDFDLIYSEDLGQRNYSGRDLHCCFNIYKRPVNGLNKKPNYKLKDVQIIEYRRDGREIKIPDGYDYAMGSFGAGCVGKKIDYVGKYARECYFYIKNEKLKNEIMDVLTTTNWKEISRGISGTYRLPQWKIYKYIKEQIPEIE